jgi:hypothetical protein
MDNYCFSFLATRAIPAPGRVVEVLAAVDAKSLTANVPGQRVSFTGKLASIASQAMPYDSTGTVVNKASVSRQ